MRKLALLMGWALTITVVCAQPPAYHIPAEPNCWREVTSFDGSKPVARHEAAYVRVGEKHYLVGGRRIQSVSIYDPARKVWSEGAAPPIELHHFQPVVWNDEIWIGGALTGKYPAETPITHFYIYNPAQDAWRTGPEIPENRRRGSTGTVVHDDKIWLVCGIEDGHRSGHKTWLDAFDPETGTWEILPDAPRARDHFQATVAEGKLYVLGGRRSKAPKNVFGDTEAAVDVFDFESGTWMTLDAQLPTPRAGSFNTRYGNEVLVIGGESGDTGRAHDEVEALDIHEHTFRSWPALEQGRHGTGVVNHHDILYVASGNGSRGGGNELPHVAMIRPIPKVAEYALEDIIMRDPCIVPVKSQQAYYLYGGTDEPWESKNLTQGVVAYKSTDLKTWRGPYPVFETPADSWSDPWAPVWAPEVHRYQGKYYLFYTHSNPAKKLVMRSGRPTQYLRATAIAVSRTPLGPFKPLSEEPVTPLDWMSLDGTLWEEEGKPWMVFCHEWWQVTDGTFELVEMAPDLTKPVGKPQTLFSASSAPWAREMSSLGFKGTGYVSDGAWLHRTPSGKLIMLWSTFSESKYAVGVATSESGTIQGPWKQAEEPLFSQNGGHGMLFRTFDGKLMFTCHAPNSMPDCRAVIYEVIEEPDGIKLGPKISQ
ncbi:family 43 glycosylhydrolase [Pontibacter sp. G13]|uniref:family 43 glycosylhydrolase n=1 Tax=Pontibacter sp. G13 TaxID=3074898 RepID=UPI002889ADC2|nr:family 43 glycosylhydrolase [Pontibacter sp. G13]WNJ19118.1 family 43 glycosylhydrolase [Pontibacter sp. G13]